MKTKPSSSSFLRRSGLAVALAALVGVATTVSAEVPATLDTFDRADATSLGTMRLPINDAELGGKSGATPTFADGTMRMEGTIAPGRGQPGFVSLVLLLSPQGEVQDLSAYEGIRLRVRVTKGNLSVLAASSEIQNFDYHTAPIARTGKEFKELKIPFAAMKRIWSEQTPLNLATITSINLVASGLQPGAFDYEVDEIGFY